MPIDTKSIAVCTVTGPGVNAYQIVPSSGQILYFLESKVSIPTTGKEAVLPAIGSIGGWEGYLEEWGTSDPGNEGTHSLVDCYVLSDQETESEPVKVYLRGLGISVNSSDGKNNYEELSRCQRVIVPSPFNSKKQWEVEVSHLTLGDGTEERDVSIQNGYIYLAVQDQEFDVDPDEGVFTASIYFNPDTDSSSSSFESIGYDPLDSQVVELQTDISTVTIPGNFNPILNNVVDLRKNEHTRVVETDIVTHLAYIPDSFYTGVSNISGRFSGTKVVPLSSTAYLNNKQEAISKNWEYLSGSSVQVSESSIVQTSRERPYYSVQFFTGSIFVSGSTMESIQSMSVSELLELDRSTIGFAASSEFSGSTVDTVKVGYEFVHKLYTLPKIGDILYSSEGVSERIVNRVVYVPENGQILRTSEYGQIIEIGETRQ